MIYQTDLGKLYHADAFELISSLQNESVDFFLTSPPYNVGIDYTNWNDSMSWESYYDWLKNLFSLLYLKMKNDGRLCINLLTGAKRSDVQKVSPVLDLYGILRDIGYHHHAMILWVDATLSKRTAWGSYISASCPYISSSYEAILVCYKENWKKNTKGESTISKEEFAEGCSGAWRIQPEKDRNHPAPFPLKLAERCINLFTYVGDLVLDPFVGSGTTAVACGKLSRRWVCGDNSMDYLDKAKNRIQYESNKKRVFG